MVGPMATATATGSAGHLPDAAVIAHAAIVTICVVAIQRPEIAERTNFNRESRLETCLASATVPGDSTLPKKALATAATVIAIATVTVHSTTSRDGFMGRPHRS